MNLSVAAVLTYKESGVITNVMAPFFYKKNTCDASVSSVEQYYKPSSVFDDHLSGPNVTTRLKRPTLKHDGQPYRLKFGLASSGVYMASYVTARAVVS